jgi:hypothetical protein
MIWKLRWLTIDLALISLSLDDQLFHNLNKMQSIECKKQINEQLIHLAQHEIYIK